MKSTNLLSGLSNKVYAVTRFNYAANFLESLGLAKNISDKNCWNCISWWSYLWLWRSFLRLFKDQLYYFKTEALLFDSGFEKIGKFQVQMRFYSSGEFRIQKERLILKSTFQGHLEVEIHFSKKISIFPSDDLKGFMDITCHISCKRRIVHPLRIQDKNRGF